VQLAEEFKLEVPHVFDTIVKFVVSVIVGLPQPVAAPDPEFVKVKT
jgi:hypothetical protein